MEGKVKTSNATEITKQSAKLHGEVKIALTGTQTQPDITSRGFLIEANNYNENVSEKGGESSFSIEVNSLKPNTKYRVQAFITINYRYDRYSYDDFLGSTQTFYGNTIEFTTKDGVVDEGDGDNTQYINLPNLGIAVQKVDLGSGDWETAKTMCRSSRVGSFSDWRLPTKAELLVLYGQKVTIGGFSNTNYWSSTEDSAGWLSYYVNFGTGISVSTFESTQFMVRAVRTLP